MAALTGEVVPGSGKGGKKSKKHKKGGKKDMAEDGEEVPEGQGGPKKRKAIDINFEYSNPKTELMAFIQAKIGKGVKQGDIVYELAQSPGGFQAMLTLVCLEGKQFQGEVSQDRKKAEASAAASALKEYE